MTVNEILRQASQLSLAERRELIKLLTESLEEDEQRSPKRSILELRGLGAHLYDGTDAQEYVNKLREEWNDRP